MSRVSIAIFEDHKVLNFVPLVYTRPFFMLKIGIKTIIDRISSNIGKVDYLYIRNYMAELFRRNGVQINADVVDQDIMFINARINPLNPVIEKVKYLLEKEEGALISNGDVIAVKTNRRKALRFIDYILSGNYAQFYRLASRINSLYVDPSSLPLIEYPFQLLKINRRIILDDLKNLAGTFGKNKFTKKCIKVVGRKDKIFVEAGVVIEDYVFFNTTNGPIYIDEGAELGPITYVEGPAYIGKNVKLLTGSKVKAGSVIGAESQIEGIVENSVLLGRVRTGGNVTLQKSSIGENVLIGSNVSIGDSWKLHGFIVENNGNNGLRRIVEDISVIGDYAIIYPGTSIDSSVRIGVGAQVHGIIEENVPSFTVYRESGEKMCVEMGVEKSITTVKKIASITGAETDTKLLENIIRYVYWSTSGERNRLTSSHRRIFRSGWI